MTQSAKVKHDDPFSINSYKNKKLDVEACAFNSRAEEADIRVSLRCAGFPA